MIDLEKLKTILTGYKAYFPSHWDDEKYKWEAVKHFQERWDIDAENFGEMFKQATDKTYNLLSSGYTYPRGMITNFAKADGGAVRAMFLALFDETVDLAVRVDAFQAAAEELRAKYDDGTWRNHYQNTNAISTYLWLRYPDKYYIYKYELFRAAASELSANYMPKRNGSVDSLIGGYRMYDEICAVVKADNAIRGMIRSALTPACYPDPEMKTATIDVGFYLARFYPEERKSEEEGKEWFPKDYSPNLSVDDWVGLLKDASVFTYSALQIVARMKDYGGQATCKQLSIKYGESPNFYNGVSSALARRIAEKTACPVMPMDTENAKWWPILYTGKNADRSVEGTYIWRLRSELSEALDKVDLSGVALYADTKEKTHGYWWLTANPKIWSFADIKVGEEQSYTLYNENGNKRRVFQNFLDAKAGDIVIGYEANPVKKVVAIARITQENDGKAIYFEKTEGLPTPIEYAALRECPELDKMEFFVQPNGSLFKLTKGEYGFIIDIIREENPLRQSDGVVQKYTKADFLNKVYMTEERYDVLEALLRSKMNVILQGAPGVGKTFTAKKLAYALMGEADDSRIEMVQFHQNYSYEDFIIGYRPDGAGFKLTEGIFYRFCQTAANHPEKEYFFIIDEINRGNMSKIFGELLMLIERDYRGTKTTLAYSGMPFSVPGNLYIIGMMNTADRSLAMIDYALRRRFSFFEIEPGFNSEGFTNYQSSLANETFNALIDQIKLLNKEITDDKSLGRGFQIGHSYFCGRENEGCSNEWMRSVVEFDILPMLGEYWFDAPAKLQRWEKNLRGLFDD
ncbi:restriction endonuclease [Synergistes jonesii]|uniref:Restriction endonuclease n=2 Tax=Synergistes jonesii TaxID=2754 RepID=A0A073IRL1_9BACT|nr:restriction endonuclease [Synergistes jonesii]OFB63057.1 restriction endonuclease [Synergistes jonesii]OFB63931.1 restriction endonuclease [Synergistes jonesii]OFB65864.1 restriction endonuclease [Synergistes jonesii]OFB67798.1 restriction endonuclease [Synergistes jonesii]